MHHSKRLQASRRLAVRVDNDSALWCLCQEPEDSRFMIQCDIQGSNCKIWYHGDCVGVSSSQGRRMERTGENFICPICSDHHGGNVRNVCGIPSPAVTLPPYVELPAPSFRWNDTIEGNVFCQKVSTAYDEIVHWQRNLFRVPYGRVGGDFVQELAKLFHSYGEAGALEAIALKAAMLMCALLLQKPHSRTSNCDLVSCLQRCCLSGFRVMWMLCLMRAVLFSIGLCLILVFRVGWMMTIISVGVLLNICFMEM